MVCFNATINAWEWRGGNDEDGDREEDLESITSEGGTRKALHANGNYEMIMSLY